MAGSQDRDGGFGCSGQDHGLVPVEVAGGADDHPNHRRGMARLRSLGNPIHEYQAWV